MKRIATLAFCFMFLSTIAQVPTDGMVGYYPFSGNADDESGNGFNGAVNGATLTQDRYSVEESAYSFNGVSSYIAIEHDPALKPNFPFSLSMWFRVDDFGESSSILYASSEVESVYSGFWLGYLVNGTLSAGYGDGTGNGGGDRVSKSVPEVLELNTWHHVLAVFNGLNDIDIYLDCELKEGDYTGSATSMQPGTGNTVVGRSLGHSMTAYHDGAIDDIRLFNVAMDAEGIEALCLENPYVNVSESEVANFRVYPNPAGDYIQIFLGDFPSSTSILEVRDAIGRLVSSEVISPGSPRISTLTWGGKGLYFLSVVDYGQQKERQTLRVLLN